MSDYEPLIFKRKFQCSVQEVWDAWTKPEKFKQWYMPVPFRVVNCEFDVRPGGLLKVDTQGPDGAVMTLLGEFKQVAEPHSLIITNAPIDADSHKLFEIQHSIVITETDGSTLLEVTSEVLWAGANADQFLIGMKPGFEQALDQMGKLLEL